jgi:hypothetical protein
MDRGRLPALQFARPTLPIAPLTTYRLPLDSPRLFGTAGNESLTFPPETADNRSRGVGQPN